MKDYCVELKVCEGCGALFLRAAGRALDLAGMVAQLGGRWVTCHACALRLSEFPAPRTRKRRGFERRAVRTAVCAGGAR